MKKKNHKVLRKTRTKGVLYLMQNPDDPLDIIGEVTDLEVMANLRIKQSRFDSQVSVLAPFYKGCILIEKETSDKRYLTNEPVLIHTTETGRKYYAYPDCTVRYTKKRGGMRTLANYKHKTKWMVKINKKEVNAARIYAKAFIKRDLDSNDCVLVYGKELKLDALEVVDKSKCASITGALAKPRFERRNVGLYKNGALIRSWPSCRKAAKDLFCSYQTVLDVCHGKVKKPMFDLRFL